MVVEFSELRNVQAASLPLEKKLCVKNAPFRKTAHVMKKIRLVSNFL
jgi:hypothetical protein